MLFTSYIHVVYPSMRWPLKSLTCTTILSPRHKMLVDYIAFDSILFLTTCKSVYVVLVMEKQHIRHTHQASYLYYFKLWVGLVWFSFCLELFNYDVCNSIIWMNYVRPWLFGAMLSKRQEYLIFWKTIFKILEYRKISE